MTRGFVLVMDSVGIGAAADAAALRRCRRRYARPCRRGLRAGAGRGALRLPHLERLGLGAAAEASTGRLPAGFAATAGYRRRLGLCRRAEPRQGHAERPLGDGGRPGRLRLGLFPAGPAELPGRLDRCADRTRRGARPARQSPCLGHRRSSRSSAPSTSRTGKPIVYTSADSVLQIAAHEERFGLERLYALCRIARILADPYNIGRVIARPFIGAPGSFRRTAHRHDYAVPPPEPTLLDRLAAHGGTRHRHRQDLRHLRRARDIGIARPPADNEATFDALLGTVRDAPEARARFRQFQRFRHALRPSPRRRRLCRRARGVRRAASRNSSRRCVPATSRSSPPTTAAIRPGAAPTIPASTCRFSPSVPAIAARPLGRRDGFADIGQSLARHLDLPALPHGTSFL